jgi:hypothetical protein
MNDVTNSLIQASTERGHPSLRQSFAASSTLAHGASANIFASADEVWMNWATERNSPMRCALP